MVAIHETHRGRDRGRGRWLLAGATLALTLLVAGCPRECRVDGDCPLGDGLFRCSEAGTCVPLEAEAAPTCEAEEDCKDGRACVQGHCVFAPRCQAFSEAARLDYVAVCNGNLFRGEARATTTDCETSLTLQDLGGEDRVATLGVLPATSDESAALPVSVGGALACADARYHSAKNGFALAGCTVGPASCDLGVLRQGEGAPCLDDAHCETGQTCDGAYGIAGAVTLGSCR